MNIPPVSAQARVFPIFLVAVFSVAAAAEPLLGTASESKSGSEWENVAPADEADLQLLSTWHAKLERSFDAKLRTQLTTLVEQVSRENMSALDAIYDARMRQSDPLSPRVDAQLAALSRVPGSKSAVLAPRGSGLITTAPIPTRTFPAAPAP